MRYVILATFLASFIGGAVTAQGLPTIQRETALGGLRALGDADEAAEWNAVGRLDTGQSFCSATLIAADLVLTAAHCLYHPVSSLAFRPDDMVFSAGLRNGRAAAVRGVRRMVVLPGYRPLAGDDMDMIGIDLALLELQHAIPARSIRPIRTGRTGRGRDAVTVVSYGADRETYASIEEGCSVLGRSGAIRSLSCQVVSGSSGSPVLRMINGEPQVVAVVSAMAEDRGDDISIAVTLDDHLPALLNLLERGQGRIEGGANANFLSGGEDGRSGIGARFIRP